MPWNRPDRMLLRCKSLSKRHVALSGAVVEAVADVSFDLPRGGLMSIVGPSGSGKSTLLNLIAGVVQPSNGDLEFDDGTVPRIGYVLQSNALFPWMTVRRNLTYSHDLRGVPRAQSNADAERLCSQLGLASKTSLDKYPRELSGGEQRRVAIGMAIAMTPGLLLLDEPSSQLDYEARWTIQRLIQDIAISRHLAVICVTHDLEEAVFLGDKVIMLRGGRVADRFDVHLPRPRTNELRAAPEFSLYRRRLMGDHESR